ncbi:MAG TPA: PAS domain-containing protein [Bacteroidaceae bacterium]|nr:PAS domain-containing protein [Bacteroidaceae bacterium]
MSSNNGSENRLKDLLAFSLGIMSGEDGKVLVEKYADAIDNVTPYDMLKLEDRQIRMGITPAQIKGDIEKIINVFSRSLERYKWEKPAKESFLYYLMLENDAFTFRLNQVKKIIKQYIGREDAEWDKLRGELLPHFVSFREFEYHYIKKENILFPYLEECWENYRPLKVMWSLHDDIRRTLKELIAQLESDNSKKVDVYKILGKYYSLVFRMIQKENIILFPVATETVHKENWSKMHIQSFEYPFPFIETPKIPNNVNVQKESIIKSVGNDKEIIVATGRFTIEQMLMVLNTLPVDITMVDENNKVLFFNRAKDRLFPRSAAIVGRSVQNCHPPESVHIVEKIIEAFRTGKREKADFYIQLKGRFVLIQYFALRNEDGNYKGVLEVSQDVTDIRSLQGEKRLLNWE